MNGKTLEHLPGDKPGKPIPLKPDTVFTVTRLICVPARYQKGKHKGEVIKTKDGVAMWQRPAVIKATAWNAGHACVLADHAKHNAEHLAWQNFGGYDVMRKAVIFEVPSELKPFELSIEP